MARRFISDNGEDDGVQTAAYVFVYGLPYMSDELRHDSSLSLSQVGLVVACPTAGLVLARVAWGALADRIGERIVITAGLTATAALLALGTQVNGLVPLGLLFALSGAASASVYAARGAELLHGEIGPVGEDDQQDPVGERERPGPATTSVRCEVPQLPDEMLHLWSGQAGPGVEVGLGATGETQAHARSIEPEVLPQHGALSVGSCSFGVGCRTSRGADKSRRPA
jgi:hypothetical protein